MVAAYATSSDATAVAVRRALETGTVRKVEGTFEYDRIRIGKGTYWQWTSVDCDGTRRPVVALAAPWPGHGTGYMLADSLVCIGSEPPSPSQVRAAQNLLTAVQSLSAAQIAALDSGLMPEGITRGLRFAFSLRAWLGLMAVYGVLSLATGVIILRFPLLVATRTGMYAGGIVFLGGLSVLLALSIRKRPAGTPVRWVEGPVSIGDAQVGLESTVTLRIGDTQGALPYWVGHALVRGSTVRAYVDAASNELVAVLPV
jgi:hypothetical protein